MSEVKEYIDKKLRLAKLDSALLFFSSSLSLAFSVGYAYLGTEWLQYYLPMLFLGWFMPIYIGYLRGSLIKDSVEERIRGWIYFIIGLGFYVISPLLSTLVEDILNLGVYGLVVIAIVSPISGFILGNLSRKIVPDIFRIKRKELKKEVKQAFRETTISAWVLAFCLAVIFHTDWFVHDKLESVVIEAIMILALGILLLTVVYSERKARKLLRDSKDTPHTTPYSPNTTRKKA